MLCKIAIVSRNLLHLKRSCMKQRGQTGRPLGRNMLVNSTNTSRFFCYENKSFSWASTSLWDSVMRSICERNPDTLEHPVNESHLFFKRNGQDVPAMTLSLETIDLCGLAWDLCQLKNMHTQFHVNFESHMTSVKSKINKKHSSCAFENLQRIQINCFTQLKNNTAVSGQNNTLSLTTLRCLCKDRSTLWLDDPCKVHSFWFKVAPTSLRCPQWSFFI